MADDLVAFLKDRLDDMQVDAELVRDASPTFTLRGVPLWEWMLAEVGTKRRILDLCVRCHGVHDVLRLLAVPYAQHPDYDERWRP